MFQNFVAQEAQGDNPITSWIYNKQKINWGKSDYDNLSAIRPTHTHIHDNLLKNKQHILHLLWRRGEKKRVWGVCVCVRMCFMSVNSLLRMVCVFVVFCHNDGSAWDTTELCFMITSLHTICLMSCHHLCWKAPMARWCEYINTHFQAGKNPDQIRNKHPLLTWV